jgi:Cys-tRNA(Pro)/Cys-tRNA(Cys) deacylase
MTPAIRLLRQQAVEHQVLRYRPGKDRHARGIEAAGKLGLPPELVYKTLLLRGDDGRLAVGILPVNRQLDLKRMARALVLRKLVLADAAEARRSSGYVPGGISPLAQKRRLVTLIDVSAEALEILYVSAGRRGLEIGLAPAELQRLTGARFLPIAQPA